MDELIGSEKLREVIVEMYQTLFLKIRADMDNIDGATDDELNCFARDRAARELHRGLGLIVRRVTHGHV